MLSPNGRVVMISGANRGIGFAIAKALATQGYQLSLGARDPSSIDINAIKGTCHTYAWDAAAAETSQSWVDAAHAHFSRIDAIVMNAGIHIPSGLEDGLEEDMDAMWDVNFKGPLRLVRAALPALRESGEGRVLNVVSLAGVRLLNQDNLGYSASKFAAMSLTHAIRQHGWDDGIRATAICPGLVDTDMVADVTPPKGQFKITPEAIAETACYALSLPNSASVAEIRINSRLECLV